MDNELEKTVTDTQETESKKVETEPTIAELKVLVKQLEEKNGKLETENGKLRQANTNASADASKWKRQYQEKLSEEDRKREDEEESKAAMQKELEILRTTIEVANNKSELLSIGFEDGLALEVATAINSGDSKGIFDGLRKFIKAHDKQLSENAFRNNPVLQSGGASTKAITREQFDKMGYTERLKVFDEHPDLYQEYTK